MPQIHHICQLKNSGNLRVVVDWKWVREWEHGDIHKYINNSTRDEMENGGILLYFHLRNDRINLQKRGERPLPVHGGKRQLMVPGGQLMAKNDPASLWQAMPDRQVMGKASNAGRPPINWRLDAKFSGLTLTSLMLDKT